jgi:hypothetical protein
MKLRLLLLSITAGALMTAGIALGQSGGQAQSSGKTTICHRTSSLGKPYVRMRVSNKSLAAHLRHSWDVIPAPPTCPTQRQPLTPTRGGRPLHAMLTGALGGDPDGAGTALVRLNPGLGVVCYQLSVSNILLPATAAHIHRGSTAAIVVGLTAPDVSGAAQGCTTGVARALVKEILRDPSAFYVNVHTTDYPGGAIRGDLSK